MKKSKILCLLVVILPWMSVVAQKITTGTLLNEMIDLQRLPEFSQPDYKTIQFSSYDRRSTSVAERGWFANSDGFGNEPIPGFEAVINEPGQDGIGRYLICDVLEPGVIQRLWTARIEGEISLFLDGAKEPVYQGSAEGFLWNFLEHFAPGQIDYEGTLKQYDALYFPIPFAKSCRIEWKGDIKKLHFYHIGVRIYNDKVDIATFKPSDLSLYSKEIANAIEVLKNPMEKSKIDSDEKDSTTSIIKANSKNTIFEMKGSKVIKKFSMQIISENPEFIYRQLVMNIYFDNASIPQVQSPIGDFFGSVPGINPYESLPLTVVPDGTMICRFHMPFKKSIRVEVENYSDIPVNLSTKVSLTDYDWKEGDSMHFNAKWRINHNMTASSKDVKDVPYLVGFGKGKIVGTALHLYNPSNIPDAVGSWWGEGDEKIFIDQDEFPSFFGTGSEDYYNYSWSSNRIFSYPYCGQPKNDGPANRGFVSNFRWHIWDNISFAKKLAFYMELYHHEQQLRGFSYGRIIYFYALPGFIDDHLDVSSDDVREIPRPFWLPEARNRVAGYMFVQAEDWIKEDTEFEMDEDPVWSKNSVVMWEPQKKGDQLKFDFGFSNKTEIKTFAITFALIPNGGKVSLRVDGKLIKLNNEEIIDLNSSNRKMLRTYWARNVEEGNKPPRIVLENQSEGSNNKIGIDFFWIKISGEFTGD